MIWPFFYLQTEPAFMNSTALLEVSKIFCAPIHKTTTEAIKHFMLVALVVLYVNLITDIDTGSLESK
jgi:hypothetical protein